VYFTQKVTNVQKSDLQVEMVGGGGEVKEGDVIKVKMTIPKPPAGKKYHKASLLIDTPIPCMVMPLMVSQDHIDLTDADIARGVVEKEFKLGHMGRAKKCDFSVTFNSEELSGIHGSMELKYNVVVPKPAPTYGDTTEYDFSSSWSISGGSWSWSSSWGY